MNTNFAKLFLSLICFFLTHFPCHGETKEEFQEYIQTLHEHRNRGAFFTIEDDFRERLKHDTNGTLVRELLRDHELRGILFVNFDVAPDKFVDLILAEHLVDNSQWESQGGLFRSPSPGIASAIGERFRPKDLGSRMPPDSLGFVLEDKEMRSKISKVLRDLSSDKEMSPDLVIERRNAARDEIVELVNGSYERLLKAERSKREEYHSSPQSSGPTGTDPKLIQEKSSEHPLKPSSTTEANHETMAHKKIFWWYGILSLIVLAAGVWTWHNKKST